MAFQNSILLSYHWTFLKSQFLTSYHCEKIYSSVPFLGKRLSFLGTEILHKLSPYKRNINLEVLLPNQPDLFERSIPKKGTNGLELVYFCKLPLNRFQKLEVEYIYLLEFTLDVPFYRYQIPFLGSFCLQDISVFLSSV